jgi:hypothetical protein
MITLPYKSGSQNCSAGGGVAILWVFVVLVSNIIMFNPKYKGEDEVLPTEPIGIDEKNPMLQRKISIKVSPNPPGKSSDPEPQLFICWWVRGETAATLHKVYMIVISILVVSMVLIGTDRFGAGVLIVVLMSCFLLSMIISTRYPGWCPKTSLVEFHYAALFGIIPALITDAVIVT